jgi:purine-binding chemotaxis protein CheW
MFRLPDVHRAESAARRLNLGAECADRVKMNTTSSAGQWLMCGIGDRLLAVPLSQVVETMRPLPLEEFAGVPDFVLGVSVIRGAVVPVISVDSVLGGHRSRPGRFVTIRLDDRVIALAVDAVLGVRTLSSADVHDVPPLLGALDQSAVSAIGTLDDRFLLVLGDARLVPEAAWARLEESARRQDPALTGSAGAVLS